MNNIEQALEILEDKNLKHELRLLQYESFEEKINKVIDLLSDTHLVTEDKFHDYVMAASYWKQEYDKKTDIIRKIRKAMEMYPYSKIVKILNGEDENESMV